MEEETQRQPQREINELDIRQFFKGRGEFACIGLVNFAGVLPKSLMETQVLRNLVGQRSRERWEACYSEGMDKQTIIQNIIEMAREPVENESIEGAADLDGTDADEFTVRGQAYGYLMYAKREMVLEIARSGGKAQIQGKTIDMTQLEFTAEQWAWCAEGNRRVKDRITFLFHPTRRPRPEPTRVVMPMPKTVERLNMRATVLATEPAPRDPRYSIIPYYESKEALLSYVSKYLKTPIQISKFLRNKGFYDMGPYGVLDFRKFLSTNDQFELALVPAELSSLNEFSEYVMTNIEYRRRILNWARQVYPLHIHFYVHAYCHSGHLGASFEDWYDCIDQQRKTMLVNLRDLLLGEIETKLQYMPLHKILSNITNADSISSNQYIFTRYGFVDYSEYRLTQEEINLLRIRYSGALTRHLRKMCSFLMKIRIETSLVDPDNDFLTKKFSLPPNVTKILSKFNETRELEYDDGFVYGGERGVLSSCFEPHEEWYVWTQPSYASRRAFGIISKLHKYAFQKYLNNSPIAAGDFINDYGWNPVISASIVGKTCGFPERTRSIHSLLTEDEFIGRMEALVARTAQDLGVFTFISWNHARNKKISLADATDAAKPYLLHPAKAPDFLIVSECPHKLNTELEKYNYITYVVREQNNNSDKYFELVLAVHVRIAVSYIFAHERYITIECAKKSNPTAKFLVTGAHLHKKISGRDNVYENFVITSIDPNMPQMYVGDFNGHKFDDLANYDLYDGNLENRFMDVCYTKNLDGYCVSVPGNSRLERSPHRVLVGQFELRTNAV